MTMIFLRNKVAAAIGDAYAIGGASPELVAAFTTQSDGTTAGEYYRKASSETTFSGLFTFSRSGTATYFDSNGTMQTAADGVARTQAYRYNSGWELAGMQMEAAAATNLHTNSRDFSTWWKTPSSSSAQNSVGIDGVSNTAWTLTQTTGTQYFLLETTIAADTSAYVFSIFVKKTVSPSTYPGVRIQAPSLYDYLLDHENGVLVKRDSSSTIPSSFVEDFGDFWRFSFQVANNGVNTNFRVLIFPSVDTNADATWASPAPAGSAVFDQTDLIAATSPSSPIITSGSTVTRAAETLTIAGADTPANTTAMSISMKGLITYADTDTASQATFLRWFADGSNHILWYLYTNGGTGGPYVIQAAAGTSDLVLGSGSSITPGVNSPFSLAARHTSGAINLAINGTADTANTTPTALADLSSTTLQVGQSFGGFISEFRIFGADIGDSGIAEVTS